MSRSPGPAGRDRLGLVLRYAVLFLLLAAPLALGSIHRAAYVPLLIGLYVTGLTSWARGHWARAHGAKVPPVPGRVVLLAFAGLVLAQLVLLPPAVLRAVSPGTYRFHDATRLLPLDEWRPVTVSPLDTALGLAFLGGMVLLYGTVFREFGDRRWRQCLALTLVAAGSLMTLVALVQAASGTTRIFGLWRPRDDWAVFGPYLNSNHFAAYIVMVVPLALSLAIAAATGTLREWRRRRHGWTALGEPEGMAAVRRTALATLLVVGLIATGSRAGFLGFVVSALALPLALRRKRVALVLIAAVAVVSLTWLEPSKLIRGFETRGVQGRLGIWQDAVRAVPEFPMLGAGFNAFPTIYPLYQTVWKDHMFSHAESEYVQVLIEAGAAGAGLVLALAFLLFRAAVRAAPGSPLGAGLLGSLLAGSVVAGVENHWQIPANAAAFAALSGLVLRGSRDAGEPPGRG